MASGTKISTFPGLALTCLFVAALIMVQLEMLSANEATAADATVASTLGAGLPFDEVPFYFEWASSPHADATAEAFTHWNKEGEIPATCASCHSTPGFLDYLTAVDPVPDSLRAAAIGTVITCMACHNEAARKLSSVVFPSGLSVQMRGPDVRCMHCHGGVQSTQSVDKAVAGLAEDEVAAQLSFINVHYRAAAATMMGSETRIAYEYPGKTYAGRLDHPGAAEACTSCHQPHTAGVKVADCAICHAEVKDLASLRLISKKKTTDNSRSREPVALRIDRLHQQLLTAIQSYAASVSGKPIAYAADAYPYFFVDTDADGTAAGEEVTFANKYDRWTPRLLKATYNYQFVEKDPGAYAHNPDYAIQVLYDSIGDLGVKVETRLGEFRRP